MGFFYKWRFRYLHLSSFPYHAIEISVKRILHLMCKHYFVKVKNAQINFMAASFWVQRNMLPQF